MSFESCAELEVSMVFIIYLYELKAKFMGRRTLTVMRCSSLHLPPHPVFSVSILCQLSGSFFVCLASQHTGVLLCPRPFAVGNPGPSTAVGALPDYLWLPQSLLAQPPQLMALSQLLPPTPSWLGHCCVGSGLDSCCPLDFHGGLLWLLAP